MKSECLPFTSIPHTTDLFRDYLYHFDRVRHLFAADPRNRQQLIAVAEDVRRGYANRREVAEILDRQNRAFGASASGMANIDRLRNGAVAAVTGQQVGLFGGPLYAILKAASAVRLARDLTAEGVDCVPVFWLATEDHDLVEVNHVTFLNPEGLPERLETPSHGSAGAPVSEVQLGEEIVPVLARACELLGSGEVADALRDSYRPGESLGTAYGKLFARLFSDYGLILMDPSDKALHALARPIYRQAIEKAELLDASLLERGRQLREGGYHEQVKVTPATTLLFEKRNGTRTVIHRANGRFSIGSSHTTAAELLARVEAEPHRFSANVLLRPVVQDYLLPTVGYFGGPAEVAYFAQLAVVANEILGRVTPVLPRFSATLLDARAQRLMNKYGLALPDLFLGEEPLRQRLAAKQLPAELNERFERETAAVSESITRLAQSLRQLDPTLVASAERAGRRMIYQVHRLRNRAATAELRRHDELTRHAAWLSANLYPDKGLQERELAGMSYLARSGREVFEQFVALAGDCPDHQIVDL